MITFQLNTMNAVQLARLYILLLGLYRTDEADLVYLAGCNNCGAEDFCREVANANR